MADIQLPVIDQYFPDMIRSEDFKFRKMTIGIYEIKPLGKTADEIQAKLTDAYDKIKEKEWKDAITTITEDFNGQIVKSITLPIPNELNDATNHQWNTQTGIGQALSDKVGGIGTIQESVLNRGANLLGANKVLVNPGYFQNYTGTEPRRFSFSFTLIPNNSEEAKRLVGIITTIKKYSSATKTFGLLLTAPHFFSITFGNEYLNKLTNIRPCVVSSIDVNYSSSGFMETTMDGMPKQMMLSITFLETSTLTIEDWE